MLLQLIVQISYLSAKTINCSATVPVIECDRRGFGDGPEYRQLATIRLRRAGDQVLGDAQPSPILEPETSITDGMAVPLDTDEPVVARTRVMSADSRTLPSSHRELRQPNRRTQ
jgi:hypothetical protein